MKEFKLLLTKQGKDLLSQGVKIPAVDPAKRKQENQRIKVFKVK